MVLNRRGGGSGIGKGRGVVVSQKTKFDLSESEIFWLKIYNGHSTAAQSTTS